VKPLEGIEPVGDIEELVERQTRGGGELGLEDTHQACFFQGQGLADDSFLQEGIAGTDKAMLGQGVHDLAKDIDGLATDACRLLRTQQELLTVCGRTQPIVEEVEDTLALFEDCVFAEWSQLQV